MILEELKLHQYDMMKKKDFLFEIENKLYLPYECINEGDIIRFYKNQFYEDFNSILNNIVNIDGYTKINFYISSLKKTVDSIRNRILGINIYLDRIDKYIYIDMEYFSSSLSKELYDIDYLNHEENEFKLTLDFDINETFNLINYFRNIVNCFSSELEEFYNRLNNQLISLKDILCNPPSTRLIIPYNILIAVFSFLTEAKLLKLENGENVNKTLAGSILPKYFVIEKDANAPFAGESVRKLLSITFETHKKDNLIQNLYNFLCNNTGKQSLSKNENPSQSKIN